MTHADQLPGEDLRRAFVLEDDEGVRRSLQLLLHWRGYDVRSFHSAANLLAAWPSLDGAILLADYHLPDGNGVDVLRELHRRGWTGRSVLITAFSTPDLVSEAKASGYDAVLEKPLRQHALVAALAD